MAEQSLYSLQGPQQAGPPGKKQQQQHEIESESRGAKHHLTVVGASSSASSKESSSVFLSLEHKPLPAKGDNRSTRLRVQRHIAIHYRGPVLKGVLAIVQGCISPECLGFF